MPSRGNHLLVGTSPLRIAPYILQEIRGTRILDAGCGAGIYGYLLRNKWQDTFPGRRQFEDFWNRDPANDQPSLLIGCDVQTENIRRVRHHRIYDDTFLASVERLPLPDNYVDTAICIEVLEHLAAEKARLAIRELARVSRLKVVVTVPRLALDHETGEDRRSFVSPHAPEGVNEREWLDAETHKSAFTAGDLTGAGFKIGNTIEGRRLFLLRVMKRWWNVRFGVFRNQLLATMALRKDSAPQAAFEHKAAKLIDCIPDYR